MRPLEGHAQASRTPQPPSPAGSKHFPPARLPRPVLRDGSAHVSRYRGDGGPSGSDGPGNREGGDGGGGGGDDGASSITDTRGAMGRLPADGQHARDAASSDKRDPACLLRRRSPRPLPDEPEHLFALLRLSPMQTYLYKRILCRYAESSNLLTHPATCAFLREETIGELLACLNQPLMCRDVPFPPSREALWQGSAKLLALRAWIQALAPGRAQIVFASGDELCAAYELVMASRGADLDGAAAPRPGSPTATGTGDPAFAHLRCLQWLEAADGAGEDGADEPENADGAGDGLRVLCFAHESYPLRPETQSLLVYSSSRLATCAPRLTAELKWAPFFPVQQSEKMTPTSTRTPSLLQTMTLVVRDTIEERMLHHRLRPRTSETRPYAAVPPPAIGVDAHSDEPEPKNEEDEGGDEDEEGDDDDDDDDGAAHLSDRDLGWGLDRHYYPTTGLPPLDPASVVAATTAALPDPSKLAPLPLPPKAVKRYHEAFVASSLQKRRGDVHWLWHAPAVPAGTTHKPHAAAPVQIVRRRTVRRAAAAVAAAAPLVDVMGARMLGLVVRDSGRARHQLLTGGHDIDFFSRGVATRAGAASRAGAAMTAQPSEQSLGAVRPNASVAAGSWKAAAEAAHRAFRIAAARRRQRCPHQRLARHRGYSHRARVPPDAASSSVPAPVSLSSSAAAAAAAGSSVAAATSTMPRNGPETTTSRSRKRSAAAAGLSILTRWPGRAADRERRWASRRWGRAWSSPPAPTSASSVSLSSPPWSSSPPPPMSAPPILAPLSWPSLSTSPSLRPSLSVVTPAADRPVRTAQSRSGPQRVVVSAGAIG
ncbi:hypothetical protein CXG81DRAFT_20693 [Caulochytrium protostelioides]|uniref:Uncharacterized protein n=1 Tax=Caulochytrium protostelioides TaxID=1555241 RepID=A0A4V1IU38_9FUNG|nr:hypothetical protein CXG81DRAFT_20693 [Caulochytrium protostelioides]|eukprot:RKO99207.1 hypothetical protein CXG81DRAFT_20693 [Caulochytrium protostelioides]